MMVEGRHPFFDYPCPSYPRWLFIITWILISAIIIGCSPSSTPAVTRIPTPTPMPPLESTMLPLETEAITVVSGYVVDGGDTTPEGLLDSPRQFLYKIEREDGSFVNVAYTAFPPGPFETPEGRKIRLNFHAGTILIGDYLKAQGSYDKNTNTLTVAEEGDYIETYPKKPE
jgi:hypothetical protein